MNHFVGWDFFSSGWIEQSRPTQLGAKGQFSGTGRRDLSRDFLLDSRKWLEFLGLFARSLLSLHQLWIHWIPPDSSDETSQNSRHFQGPSKPFNFTPNYLSAAEEIPQNPSKLSAKKSSEKIALTIEHFHDLLRQKRAIKNFRFVVHFSSREFKIGCQVLFLATTHYSQNSR
jgi:hypothetical protein